MPQVLSFSTVDVFTKTAFKGNQLAIVHVPRDSKSTLSQAQKQAIAREFNFSETVFLHAADKPESSDRQLDIFTTTRELPFAGHPTIGALVYVCALGIPESSPLKQVMLNIKAGPISGRYDAASGNAEAEIPHNVHVHATRVSKKAILSSQPIDEVEGLLNKPEPSAQVPLVSIVKGMSYILVELSAGIESLNGQSQKIPEGIVELDEGWTPSFVGVYYFTVDGVIGTCCQIRARMLEESIGEDAATGSAASSLAAYMALQDGRERVVYEFDIEQGLDMGRASYINVKVELAEGGREVAKVTLGGSAVLVTEGKLHMPEF